MELYQVAVVQADKIIVQPTCILAANVTSARDNAVIAASQTEGFDKDADVRVSVTTLPLV